MVYENGMKKLNFLNVIDDRWPKSYQTIIYTKKLRPQRNGFFYSYTYDTGRGSFVSGIGIVDSVKYSKMSAAEIELTCTIEKPPTPEDIYKACITADMTDKYAKIYSGLKDGQLKDAG